MRRLGILAAATALVLASAPAIADTRATDKNKDEAAKAAFEINGFVKNVVDTGTVTVTVKTVSQSKATKTLAKAILTAGVVTVKSDTSTVVKRGGKTVSLGSLGVGDKVNLRGVCTAGSPIVCVASRVTATAAPTPKPSPLHLGLTVRGVALTNASGVVGVMVVSAETGDDNPLKAAAIRGTVVNFQTDTSTVVMKSGSPITLAALTVPAAVIVQASCTQTSPTVCTAKRITVIVPTT